MKTAKIIAISLGFMSIAAFAYAQNTTPTTSNAQKISCIGVAVNTREQAIDSAQSTLASAVNSAYSARASSLASAYQLSTPTAVRAAVKTAWSTFNTSVKAARKAWQGSRNSAWTTFRTASKACKASSLSVGDEGNSASEVSGD